MLFAYKSEKNIHAGWNKVVEVEKISKIQYGLLHYYSETKEVSEISDGLRDDSYGIAKIFDSIIKSFYIKCTEYFQISCKIVLVSTSYVHIKSFI